jgi:CheY-like chemotaxis protein
MKRSGPGFRLAAGRVSMPGPDTGNVLSDNRTDRIEAFAARDADIARTSRLLADINHETRTPLTAIIGFSSLLIRMEGLSDTARIYARHIEDAGHLLAASLARLLEDPAIAAGAETDGGQLDLNLVHSVPTDGISGAETLTGLRILVVDDDPHVRELLAITLEAFGMRVSTAVDGLTCLERLAAELFDLVLMDCRMPGPSGREVLALIRLSPGPNRNVPVIAVTAELSPANADVFTAFDGRVTKPISVEGLVQAVLGVVVPHAGERADDLPAPNQTHSEAGPD